MADTNTQQEPRAPDDGGTNTARQGKVKRGKTRDAFAFRDFDDIKILCRPYFNEIFNHIEPTLFFAAKHCDEMFLHNIGFDDCIDFKTYNWRRRKLEKLVKFNGLLDKYKNLIVRHIERLNKFQIALADKIASSNVQIETRRSKYRRVKNLIEEYKSASLATIKLVEKAERAYKNFNKLDGLIYRKKFAEKLKLARQRKKMTQAQVAAELELTVGAYQFYETARREPNIATLIQLSTLLGVTPNWLLGFE